MGKKDQYDAIADNGDESADVGVEFKAISPEKAREKADEALAGTGHRTAAVINERTGERTDF